MEEIKFKSLNELYTRLYPAFNTKVCEFRLRGISIKEIELWNFLKENKWSQNTKLSICDMVSDIMKIDELALKEYIKNN